jgi:hypothetical protein
MNKYVAELIGTFFLVLTVGCTVIAHGADPFAPLAIGSTLRALQSGRYARRLAAREVRGQRCSAVHDFSDHGDVLAAFAVKFLKGGTAVTPLQPAIASASGKVSFHLCARLRRAKRRYAQDYRGQFFLWTGDRIHSAGGGVFRRQYFRWSVQPNSRRVSPLWGCRPGRISGFTWWLISRALRWRWVLSRH